MKWTRCNGDFTPPSSWLPYLCAFLGSDGRGECTLVAEVCVDPFIPEGHNIYRTSNGCIVKEADVEGWVLDYVPIWFPDYVVGSRQNLSLSVHELARRAKCSRFWLSKVESGKANASRELAEKLIAALQAAGDEGRRDEA